MVLWFFRARAWDKITLQSPHCICSFVKLQTDNSNINPPDRHKRARWSPNKNNYGSPKETVHLQYYCTTVHFCTLEYCKKEGSLKTHRSWNPVGPISPREADTQEKIQMHGETNGTTNFPYDSILTLDQKNSKPLSSDSAPDTADYEPSIQNDSCPSSWT